MKENISNNYLMDKPIDRITKDEFDNKSIVDEIVHNIKSNEPPYNIALIGKWGTGKSSILECVENEFNKDEYLFVRINAWKYEKQEIRRAFIFEILNELPKISGKVNPIVVAIKETLNKVFSAKIEEDKSKATIKDISAKIFSNTMALVLGCGLPLCLIFLLCIFGIDFVLSCFNIKIDNYNGIMLEMAGAFIVTLIPLIYDCIMKFCESKKPININVSEEVKDTNFYEEQMKVALAEYEKKKKEFKSIICIVEDIDRLNADKMVEAINALKSFIGTGKIIFIVPYDNNILSSVLERCKNSKISSNYEILEGEMILNKLFQYKIYMPELIQEDMYEYAKKIVSDSTIPNLFKDKSILYDNILPVLMYEETKTPRDVKQLVNSYMAKYNIAVSRGIVNCESKEQLQLMAVLTVLENDFNEFYSEIVNYPNIIEYFLENKRTLEENDEESQINEEGLALIYKRLKKDIYRGSKFKKLEAFLKYTKSINKDNIERLVYLNYSKIDKIGGGIASREFRSALINCNLNKAREYLSGISRVSELISRELSYRDFYKKKNIVITMVGLYKELSNIDVNERKNISMEIEKNLVLLDDQDIYELKMIDIIKIIEEFNYTNCNNLYAALRLKLYNWKPTYLYVEDKTGEVIEDEKALLEEELTELIRIYSNVDNDIQREIKKIVESIGNYNQTEEDVQESETVYKFSDFFNCVLPTLGVEEYNILGEDFLKKALILVIKNILNICDLQKIKEIYIANNDIDSFIKLLFATIEGEDERMILNVLENIQSDIPLLNRETKKIIFSTIEAYSESISQLDRDEYKVLDNVLSLICVDIIKDDEDNSIDAVLKSVEDNIYLTLTIISLANNNMLGKIEQTIRQINDKLVNEDEEYDEMFGKICKKYTNEEKSDLLEKLLSKISEYQGNISIIRTRFDVIKTTSNASALCANFVGKIANYVITKYNNIADLERRKDMLQFCVENCKYLIEEELIKFFNFLNNTVILNYPEITIEASKYKEFINLPDENWKEALSKYILANNIEIMDIISILEKKLEIVNGNVEIKKHTVSKIITEFTDDERILNLLIRLKIDSIAQIIELYNVMDNYIQNNSVLRTLKDIVEPIEDKVSLVREIINKAEDLEMLIIITNENSTSGLETGLIDLLTEYENSDRVVNDDYRMRLLEVVAKINKTKKQIVNKFYMLLIDVLNRLHETDAEKVVELMNIGKNKLNKNSRNTAFDKLEVTISKIENEEEKERIISKVKDFK